LAITLMKPSRTTGDTMPATTTTRPVFTDPHPVIHSIDPTTAPARPHSAPGKPAGSSPGTVAVKWTLSGTCTHAGAAFACHVTLTSSNGLQSAGYVNAFPTAGGSTGCGATGALVHDSALLNGHCSTPFAANVLAIYSVSPDRGSALATALLP